MKPESYEHADDCRAQHPLTVDCDDVRSPEDLTEEPTEHQRKGWGDDLNLPGVFRARDFRMAELASRVERLNRRAKRIGATPIEIRVYGTSLEPVTRYDFLTEKYLPTGEVRVFAYFELIGERAQVNGWEFIASLEHAGEAGTIMRAAPGKAGSIPAEYRTASNTCAHCKAARNRIETFLLRREGDGAYVQIGRNCLQDFIGTTNIGDLAARAELLFSLTEICGGLDEDGMGSGADRTIYLPAYLGHVAAIIRSDGWISKARARAEGLVNSTADIAQALMFARPEDFQPRNGNPPVFTEANKVTPADFEAGNAAIEWVTTELTVKSDYEHNISVLAKLGIVREKNLGLAASIVAVHQRHLNRLSEAARVAKAGASSTHLGAVGDRMMFKAQIVSLSELPGDWGVTHVHKMVDAAGNVLTCFTGTILGERGAWVNFKATVKRHSEFKGVKETVVSRPVEYTEDAAAAEIAKMAKKAERAAKKAAKAKAIADCKATNGHPLEACGPDCVYFDVAATCPNCGGKTTASGACAVPCS